MQNSIPWRIIRSYNISLNHKIINVKKVTTKMIICQIRQISLFICKNIEATWPGNLPRMDVILAIFKLLYLNLHHNRQKLLTNNVLCKKNCKCSVCCKIKFNEIHCFSLLALMLLKHFSMYNIWEKLPKEHFSEILIWIHGDVSERRMLASAVVKCVTNWK